MTAETAEVKATWYDVDLITPSHPPFRHERQILLDLSMVLGGEDGTQQGSVPEGPEHV